MGSIYAELLTNLRQVSVRVSLSSPSDGSTSADVVDEGRRLQVLHQGEVVMLDLPVRVHVRPILPIPPASTRDLAWRLPVPASEIEPTRFSAEDQEAPWGSRDMKPGTHICCRKCDSCVVQHGTIKVWKDLPSENWAEMMEFWHCHKPHDEKHGHDHDGEGLTRRGYGADNAISAQPGVGLVDLTSFLVSESDCRDLLFSSSSSIPRATFDDSKLALNDGADSAKALSVICKACSEELGFFNVLASSVALSKWQVACETSVPSRPPSSSECLAATLISTLSRSGSSKSVVLPHGSTRMDDTQKGSFRPLHLWVLNTNVVYTSTAIQGKRTAIKLLYQNIEMESAMKLLDSMTSAVQEVNFPVAAIDVARQLLEESNLLLPESERLFQQWHVALLGRW